jgi:hypothetical protein
MKVTITVDCTPHEARAFLGLPDMTPLHDEWVQKAKTIMETQSFPQSAEEMTKTWGQMGVQFQDHFVKLMNQAAMSAYKPSKDL